MTCFHQANYSQRQSFHLADSTSSLILLDWYTSGRMDMHSEQEHIERKGQGEEWTFSRYRSENVVVLDSESKVLANDVLLLEHTHPAPTTPSPDCTTSYHHRVAPYHCYATLLLFGPSTSALLATLAASFARITQYPQSNPYELVWSFSALHHGSAGIARCAGRSTEAVREWVREVLAAGGIVDVVGHDLWQNAFN